MTNPVATRFGLRLVFQNPGGADDMRVATRFGLRLTFQNPGGADDTRVATRFGLIQYLDVWISKLA